MFKLLMVNMLITIFLVLEFRFLKHSHTVPLKEEHLPMWPIPHTPFFIPHPEMCRCFFFHSLPFLSTDRIMGSNELHGHWMFLSKHHSLVQGFDAFTAYVLKHKHHSCKSLSEENWRWFLLGYFTLTFSQTISPSHMTGNFFVCVTLSPWMEHKAFIESLLFIDWGDGELVTSCKFAITTNSEKESATHPHFSMDDFEWEVNIPIYIFFGCFNILKLLRVIKKS